MDDSDHIRIPLRKRGGEIRAHALIDPVDAHLAKLRWCMNPNGYVVRNDGNGLILMHRTILGLARGDRTLQGDHINRDRLDNRRSNLRVVTSAQNQQNLTPRRDGTSRHRGVSWNTAQREWVAHATVARKTHFLGAFAREEDAARAAASFRREHMPFSEEAAT